MKTCLQLFICIVIVSASSSDISWLQFDTLTIDTLWDGKNSDLIFPLLSSQKRPKAAQEINDYLQGSQFDRYFPKGSEDFLKETTNNPSYGFGVTHNDKYFFGCTIYWEGCGAYCSFGTYSYLFDSQSGDYIFLDKLFTQKGYDFIREDISKERQQEIDSFLSTLSKSDEYYEEIVSIYRNCGVSWKDFAYSSFYTKADTMFFTREECSNHAMRALDEVGSFRNKRTLSQLFPYLTPLGKKLFLKKEIWTGAVAQKYPITLTIDLNEKNRMKATYYYNKYGKPIALDGFITDSIITLQERDDGGKVSATITGKMDKRTFIGSWKSVQGKTLSFEASLQ